ncbi:ABC transporter permease [Yinghuangia soli]|uniref:ABC transporter permease n=1 Tax=Yinghuangia soli TaxID=2908204 RepID=A0AA41U0V0_9ACTN|nr:ABC transporter permease [Yinghuangia soli]MCF2528855.1 ABC transporter permease [Yinghuangia soli]
MAPGRPGRTKEHHVLSYRLRRTLSGLRQLAAATVVSFLLLYAASGDVARNLMGESATREQVDQKAAQLGVDQPVWTQFADWLGGAFQGDLGRSWFTGQEVTEAIGIRFPVTLSLIVGTTVLTALLSAVLGVWAGTRRGGADRFVQVLSVLGVALPGFVVALVLVTQFAIRLEWFPATGYTPVEVSFTGWLKSITLPVVALTFGGMVFVTQQLRGAVIDTLRQDWVRTLRTRGLSSRRILFVHVLRSAAGPAVSVLGLHFIGLVGGAVIIEQVFTLPGLGQYTIGATASGDLPVVMGIVLLTAVVVFAANLATDLAVGWLNPKARRS